MVYNSSISSRAPRYRRHHQPPKIPDVITPAINTAIKTEVNFSSRIVATLITTETNSGLVADTKKFLKSETFTVELTSAIDPVTHNDVELIQPTFTLNKSAGLIFINYIGNESYFQNNLIFTATQVIDDYAIITYIISFDNA